MTGFSRAFWIFQKKYEILDIWISVFLDFWIFWISGNISATKRATGNPLVSKRTDFRGLFGFMDFLIFGFMDFFLDFLTTFFGFVDGIFWICQQFFFGMSTIFFWICRRKFWDLSTTFFGFLDDYFLDLSTKFFGFVDNFFWIC